MMIGRTLPLPGHGLRPPLIVWLLLGLLLVCGLAVDGFASPGNLANVARQVAVLSLLAIGQTFIVAAGLLDLTVGAVATLVVVVSAIWMDGNGARAAAGTVLAIMLGAACGLLTGLLDRTLRINSLILTIGLMTALYGVVFMITDQSIGAPAPQLTALANGDFAGVPLSLPLLLLVLLLAHGLMHHTRFGLHLQAIGSSAEGASHAGLRIGPIIIGAFVLSGALAALAGLLLLGRLGTGYPNAGNGMELDAIVAVVLGGTLLAGGRASVVGSVAAAAVLGVISNVLNLLEVSSFAQMLIKGIIVVAVVVLQRPASGGRS